MRSANPQLPCVHPLTYSNSLQLPDGHGGRVVHGGRGKHGGRCGQDRRTKLTFQLDLWDKKPK